MTGNPEQLDTSARDDLERGRWLFAQECQFISSAATYDGVPDAHLPEIAFVGRSNVGKSTLINALTSRKTLARTSHTPGRTQMINFFQLADTLMLADLPGYGYARASKSEIKRWTALIFDYLRGRSSLRRVCLLIDARHGLKDNDIGVMRDLDEAAVSYQTVLTKCDKVKPGPLTRLVEETSGRVSKHVAAHPELIVTSSAKGTGIEHLRSELAKIAEFR